MEFQVDTLVFNTSNNIKWKVRVQYFIVASLISADSLLYKLNEFRDFLDKYCQYAIPDVSTLRKV